MRGMIKRVAAFALVGVLSCLLAFAGDVYADEGTSHSLSIAVSYDDSGTGAVLYTPYYSDGVYFGIQVDLTGIEPAAKDEITSETAFTVLPVGDTAVSDMFAARKTGSLADAVSEDGTASILLWVKAGDKAVIQGLPEGTAYTVAETCFTSQTFADAPSRIFEISYGNASGMIAEGDAAATVQNTQKTIDFVFEKEITDGYVNPDEVFYCLFRTWPYHTYTYESFDVVYPDHTGRTRTAKTVSNIGGEDYCVLLPLKAGDSIHVTVPTYAWFELTDEYILKSKYLGSMTENDVLSAYEASNTYAVSDMEFLCRVASLGNHSSFYGDEYGTTYKTDWPSVGTSAIMEDMPVVIKNGRPAFPLQLTKSVIAGTDRITSSFKVKLWEGDDSHPVPISGYTFPGTSYTTDKNGEAVVEVTTDGASQTLQLQMPWNCHYSLEEVSCSGENCDFLSINMQPGLTEYTGSAPGSRNVAFFNVQKLPVTIQKKDQSGEPVIGAQMQILDEQGKVVAAWTTKKDAETVYLAPNIAPLIPARYVLHEKQPPEGYEPAEDIAFNVYPGRPGEAQIVPVGGSPVEQLEMVDEEQLREISVKKVWEDKDNQARIRPDTVEVQLLADGEPVGEAVALSGEKDWTYTWTGLDWYSNGNEIKYTVQESNVPDQYMCTITGDAADGFVVTNTYQEEEPPKDQKTDDAAGDKDDAAKAQKAVSDKKPATGDESVAILFAGLMIASGLLLAVSRKRENE